MIYLSGTLALVLSLFIYVLFKIAFKSKSPYRYVAEVTIIFITPFWGYYIIVFLLELFKLLTNFGSSP